MTPQHRKIIEDLVRGGATKGMVLTKLRKVGANNEEILPE